MHADSTYQKKSSGGFANYGVFFAENYIREQSANLVEYGMCILTYLPRPLAPPGAYAMLNFSPTSPVLGDPLQLLPAQPRLCDVCL